MKIGIIGAGNVGGALGRACVRAGHRVAISSKDTEDAAKVAQEVGAKAADGNQGAVREADVVILAVPYAAMASILEELGDDLIGKVIVDVSNRFAAEELSDPSNAEQIQQMTTAPVVKAFNTIFASHQSNPKVDDITLDGFVAGDDDDAKATILTLVESLGFRSIDAGPLAMSRALEGMGTLNISLNMQNEWPWQTGWKLLGPTG